MRISGARSRVAGGQGGGVRPVWFLGPQGPRAPRDEAGEAGALRPLDPHEGVLEPVTVVALREILAGMRAAALGAIRRRVDGGSGLQQQVLELERLDEIGVPDERAVGDAYVGEGSESRPDPLDPLRQALAAAKYRRIQLHGLLHLQADGGG